MTIKELIEELENFEPDMEVKFGYDYGDHWHSQVCKKISDVDVRSVEYSEYHRMDKIVDKDDDDDDENKNGGTIRKLVVLS